MRRQVPDEILCALIFPELSPTDLACCLASNAAWWKLREAAARERAALIGFTLPPPPDRIGLHEQLSGRTFFYHTASALHALHGMETSVECVVSLRGSRYGDLQYHVPVLDPATGHVRHHSAWHTEVRRGGPSPSTLSPGQGVRAPGTMLLGVSHSLVELFIHL